MFFEKDLKELGKVPSERERFTMLVIGMIIESRQDLRKKVGMMSSVQEALEDLRMTAFTSSGLAGGKLVKKGGTRGGSI